MHKEINFYDLEKRQRANFINSLSGFKSANLIATINSKGLSNLAIFSSLFHLGADPALFGFIIRPDVVPRDTLTNIRANNKCTVNHVSDMMTEDAHHTSARYPKEINEFSKTDLTEEYIDLYEVPFVKESLIKYSAHLVEEISIKHNGTQMLVMQIDKVYLDPNTLQNDHSIDLAKAGSVCISGLYSYHTTKLIAKYPYAKPK